MALEDELKSEVAAIFRSAWDTRDGQKVPDPEDVKLGNNGVRIDGTVLYADLAESTALVNKYKPEFAAEIYKAYLHCAAKVIRAEGGEITAYDGDRVMAVFIGNSKNTCAARCALKINHAVIKIINPAIKAQYNGETFEVKHAVGVDTSSLFVARTGIRGANDLVWVGRAANYAAKLCGLRESNYASWITENVFSLIHDEAKYASDGRLMWESRSWKAMGITVYCSSWMHRP